MVETNISRDLWNVDKLDGTGASGINLDVAPFSWNNALIFGFDMQWLGAGRVRFYVSVNGLAIIVHEENHSGMYPAVYIQTGSLPCTYEIENISSTVASSMEQICATVTTEGSTPSGIAKKSISNDILGITCPGTAYTPVLSIRPSTLFNGRVNKSTAVLLGVELMVTGVNPAHYHILRNATLTGSTWVSLASHESMMEACTVSTGFTGGIIRDEGYCLGGQGDKSGSISQTADETFYIQIDPTGIQNSITVVARGMGGSAEVFAKLYWKELY